MQKELAYKELAELQREVNLIYNIEALLEWDQRCYIPPKGHEYRSEEISYLAVMRHQKGTAKRIGELLDELVAAGMGREETPEDVNVREWKRDYDRKCKLPEEFVSELTKTTSFAQSVWGEARAKNDFSLFQPWLEKIVALKLRQADYLGWKAEPYDALLDEYEPGASTAEIAKVLGDLRDRLVPLVKAIAGSSRKPDTSILHLDFAPVDQEAFGKLVSAAIGYDYNRGRVDQTTHPFCITLGPNDIRITTRYIPDHINGALFGTLHESGHALYEQNLPAEYAGTPMADAVSLGIHESQSRLWENIVGRSLPFWQKWYPDAQKNFEALKDVSMESFVFAINAVEPSFIRVEADETTYNLHILLRFELEQALMNGEVKPVDIPAAWNRKFREYFGIDVPNDSQGCLQDIHWSAGLIGYFPTYSIGNLNSAQFYEKAVADLGDQEENFRKGIYTPLLDWLRTNIHSQGRRYTSADLTRRVTGKPLTSDALMKYLEKKAAYWYGV